MLIEPSRSRLIMKPTWHSRDQWLRLRIKRLIFRSQLNPVRVRLARWAAILIVGSESAVLDYVREALNQHSLQLSSFTIEHAIIKLQKGAAADLILLHVPGNHALESSSALQQGSPHRSYYCVLFQSLLAGPLLCRWELPIISNSLLTSLGLQSSVKRFLELVGESDQ